jgi:hypothetical protein
VVEIAGRPRTRSTLVMVAHFRRTSPATFLSHTNHKRTSTEHLSSTWAWMGCEMAGFLQAKQVTSAGLTRSAWEAMKQLKRRRTFS